MKTVDFMGANKTLGAPAGMEADCDPLPVHCDGVRCVSCWEPTPEERAAIAAGQPIYLYVFSGQTQPPVALAVLTHKAPATAGAFQTPEAGPQTPDHFAA